MNDPYVAFAKLFLDRDNPQIITVGIGKVLSPLPNLRLQFGESIILDSEDVVLSSRVTELSLVTGDEVILIPSADKQTYYVIDKVGGV